VISHSDIKAAIRERMLTAPLRFSLTASTLSFTGAAAQSAVLNRSSGDWLATILREGDEIQIAGSTNPANDGVAIITELSTSQLRIRCPGGRSFVNEAAGSSITVTLGLPIGFQLENRKFTPVPGFPWMREAYLGGDSVGASIGPRRRVRAETLYQLSLFAPILVGTAGVESLGDFLTERIYPGLTLSRNGQNSQILTASRASSMREDEWYHLPISFTLRTHSITPD
jgi:hypothetical protein